MKEMPKIQSGPPPQKSIRESDAQLIRDMVPGQWFEIPAGTKGAEATRRKWLSTARQIGAAVRTYRSEDKFIIVKLEGPANAE